MTALTVVERPWTDLKPHPDNPRNGDVDAIAESLRAHGLYRPIVTTTDGTILAGNHTYMAAGQIGLKKMPAVVLDIDPFGDEALRIMLADNRTADLGGYDDGVLMNLLNTLSETDAGLFGTGYDAGTLKALQDHLEVVDDFDAVTDTLGSPTIVITCADEGEQEQLIGELLGRGLNVKGMWV